jgi:DNA-binding response OmpR family regulator
MHVLLAENDASRAEHLIGGLRQEGLQIDWVRDGLSAEQVLLNRSHSAAVLDFDLPGLGGEAVVCALRLARVALPVLMLGVDTPVSARASALDAGADDVVLLPVDRVELAARLRALGRRSQVLPQEALTAGPIELRLSRREVSVDGEVIRLSAREFDLLHALMRQPGRVLSREQLEHNLYGGGEDVGSNTVEVHIHHLRRKLGAERIRTVRGAGYAVSMPGMAVWPQVEDLRRCGHGVSGKA